MTKFDAIMVVMVVMLGFIVVIMGLLVWDTFWRGPRWKQEWKEYQKAHQFKLESRVSDLALEFTSLKSSPEGRAEQTLCLSIILDEPRRISYGQSGKFLTADRLILSFRAYYQHRPAFIPLEDEELVLLMRAIKNSELVSFSGNVHDDGTATIEEVRIASPPRGGSQ